MKRQTLTPEQYLRANKVMFFILMISYIVYSVVDYTAIADSGAPGGHYARIAFYVASIIGMGVLLKFKGDTKLDMVVMAALFILVYGVFVFNNHVSVMVLVFPALVGFMIYLNGRVVTAGCVLTFLFGAIKTYQVKAAGFEELFDWGNMITVGFVICIFGSFCAVNLLITFSKEDREESERVAKYNKEITEAVVKIANALDEDFHHVMNQLQDINTSIAIANETMDEIAGSSESTADAVGHQANMTGEIQERLETTNETAMQSMETTEKLKGVIVTGKKLADDLKEQSILVDNSTEQISKTVDILVENVEKVSSITDAILNISSQTNLLALNASIEAARAGDAGRGFAVVAEQIRKLAEETKLSTEQITDIIKELTAITSKTQAGIRESVDSINVQRAKVQEVNASFTEVESGMLQLESGVETMGHEVREVLEANRSIVESISMLSASSEEISAGTQTSKEKVGSTVSTLKDFSEIVERAFEKLRELKETAEAK